MRYFYDTSAIYEYMRDNQKIVPYFESHEGIVTLLVVMEAYFILLKKVSEDAADKALNMLFPLMVIPPKTLIRKAMKFRLEKAKLGFSYADALGYVYANEHNIPFLTNDSAFKGLPNVILVK